MSDLIARLTVLADTSLHCSQSFWDEARKEVGYTMREAAAALRQKEEQRAAAMNLYESTLTAQMTAEARASAAERELRAQQPREE